MSRIGKKIIIIPSTVKIFNNQNYLKIEGKYGTLDINLLPNIQIIIVDNKLSVIRKLETQKTKAFHGLTRALIQNKINDVTNLFYKTLIMEGIGYKFQLQDNKLILNVGFSHTIKLEIPSEIYVKLESPIKLQLSGINREAITLFASKIKNYKIPEPYLGKGILYEGEIILKKIGKIGKKK